MLPRPPISMSGLSICCSDREPWRIGTASSPWQQERVLTQNYVLQEYSQYSSCHSTQAIPSIVSMLASSSSAPLSALSGLLYTPNQTAVIQELLTAIGNQHDRTLREAAGELFLEAQLGLSQRGY